jgi:hypothetical protein
MSVQVFFTYPETARRSLEEVDHLFESNVKPWHTANVKDVFGRQTDEQKVQQSEVVEKEETVTAHKEHREHKEQV